MTCRIGVHRETLHQVLADLGLVEGVDVTIAVLDQDAGILNGGFRASTRELTLYVGQGRNDVQPMRLTLIQIRRTFLHELRHAWQLKEWGREKFAVAAGAGDYLDRRAERDARQWAEANLTRYSGLVYAERQRVQRPMRRLP